MRNNKILSVLFLVLMLQVTGCKKEEPKKKNNNVSEKVKTAPIVNDTIFDKKSPYYSFIQKNYPEALHDKVIYFKEKDLDLDGQNEAIIAFGNDSDSDSLVDNLLVLKNNQGSIKEIKANFGLEKYSFSKIQLISLKGENKCYISVEIFEDLSVTGFAIYEMIDNQIKQVFISGSVDENSKDYNDVLISSCNNGLFDGYIQNIQYYLFKIKKEFVYEKGNFKLKQKYFVMEEYPDSVFYVIMQYISLRSINFTDKISNQRLQELCLDKTANPGPLKVETWNLIYRNLNNNSVQMQDDDDYNTKATVEFSDLDKNINYQLKFELQNTNEKWQITKVEVVE